MRRTKIPKKRPPAAANKPPAAANKPPAAANKPPAATTPPAANKPSSASWRFWILLSALLVLGAVWGFRSYYRANQIHSLRQASRTAERGGNWQELETLSARWISIEPTNDDAWMHFASAKRHLEDWDGFVNAVEQLSPDNPFYLASLEAAVDVLIDESKDIRHAEQLLLRILAAEPSRPHAYQRLIFLYSMTLQKAKLHSVLRASVGQGSEPPEAYVYLLTLSSLNFSNGLFRTSLPAGAVAVPRSRLSASAKRRKSFHPRHFLSFLANHRLWRAIGNMAVAASPRRRRPSRCGPVLDL